MIGEGPELYEAENYCRRKGLSKDVRFLGKVNNLEQIIGIADLFLLPSEFESFGLAALEAMAAGVPVISSNTGGLPEVNEHGFSGYTTEVGNVEAMAQYAVDLLSDKEKLQAFKEQAFGQAKKFDLLNILPRYEKLYEKVI